MARFPSSTIFGSRPSRLDLSVKSRALTPATGCISPVGHDVPKAMRLRFRAGRLECSDLEKQPQSRVRPSPGSRFRPWSAQRLPTSCSVQDDSRVPIWSACSNAMRWFGKQGMTRASSGTASRRGNTGVRRVGHEVKGCNGSAVHSKRPVHGDEGLPCVMVERVLRRLVDETVFEYGAEVGLIVWEMRTKPIVGSPHAGLRGEVDVPGPGPDHACDRQRRGDQGRANGSRAHPTRSMIGYNSLLCIQSVVLSPVRPARGDDIRRRPRKQLPFGPQIGWRTVPAMSIHPEFEGSNNDAEQHSGRP